MYIRERCPNVSHLASLPCTLYILLSLSCQWVAVLVALTCDHARFGIFCYAGLPVRSPILCVVACPPGSPPCTMYIHQKGTARTMASAPTPMLHVVRRWWSARAPAGHRGRLWPPVSRRRRWRAPKRIGRLDGHMSRTKSPTATLDKTFSQGKPAVV